VDRHLQTHCLVARLVAALQRRGYDGDVGVARELLGPDCARSGTRLRQVGMASKSNDGITAALPHGVDLRHADIVHVHVDDPSYVLPSSIGRPVVVTVRGRTDVPSFARASDALRQAWCVALSDGQRTHAPGVRWCAVIPDGFRVREVRFRDEVGESLAYCGPMSRMGRMDLALEVARQCGRVLRAVVEGEIDGRWSTEALGPLRSLQFLQVACARERDAVLAESRALLCMGDDGGPGNDAVARALGHGTPTVALSGTAAARLVARTGAGAIVGSVGDAVRAIEGIELHDRRRCRRRFEEIFAFRRMVDAYAGVYERAIRLGASPTGITRADRRVAPIAQRSLPMYS
jgi:hypothetical protein